MSEETDALEEAIRLNREELLESILSHCNIKEISEERFQNLLSILVQRDEIYFKFEDTLRSQRVVDEVIKGEDEV